jgi:hypothetical protein
MAVISLGRECRLKKNSVVIGKVTAPSLSCSAGTIDLTSLGDLWNTFATGMSSYTLSFNLLMVREDANQNAIWTAFETRTALNDIELWLDSTCYITCDVAGADPDYPPEMVVTSYNITLDNNSAVQVAVTLTGSGPIKIFNP